jgi:hypothetical protein
MDTKHVYLIPYTNFNVVIVIGIQLKKEFYVIWLEFR